MFSSYCRILIILMVLIGLAMNFVLGEEYRISRRVVYVIAGFAYLIFMVSSHPEASLSYDATTVEAADSSSSEKSVVSVYPNNLDKYETLLSMNSEVTWTLAERPSELTNSKGVTYIAENMNDKDLSTSWQDGTDGYALGETFKIDLTRGISGFMIANGNLRDPENTYYSNGRVKTLRITDDSGESVTVDLEDKPIISVVNLTGFENSSYLYIEIEDVYTDGADCEDTCIAEITTFTTE